MMRQATSSTQHYYSTSSKHKLLRLALWSTQVKTWQPHTANTPLFSHDQHPQPTGPTAPNPLKPYKSYVNCSNPPFSSTGVVPGKQPWQNYRRSPRFSLNNLQRQCFNAEWLQSLRWAATLDSTLVSISLAQTPRKPRGVQQSPPSLLPILSPTYHLSDCADVVWCCAPAYQLQVRHCCSNNTITSSPFRTRNSLPGTMGATATPLQ